MTNADYLHNGAVIDFVETAERFCSLVENFASVTPSELVYRFADLLPALYRTALALPEVEATDEQLPTHRISTEEAATLCKQIGVKLGKWNLYRCVYDAYAPLAEGQVEGLLSDDLVDIYRDVNEGLHSFRSGDGNGAQEAIWQWRFSFLSHWGRHATDALKAIHDLFADYIVTKDKTDTAGDGR